MNEPRIPPIPRDPDAPITDSSVLKVGDVVQIAVQLRDKATGQPFWWKRFACVGWAPRSSLVGGHRTLFRALTLKMHVDMTKDYREIDLDDEKQVVTLLPEDKWPQGVVAMRMKAITLGHIKLG